MLRTQSLHQTSLYRSMDASRAFERYILANPEICSECFAKIKEVTEEQINDWGDTTEYHDRVEDGVLGYDDVDGAWRPRTFCQQCGGRGRIYSDTLSKREALARVDRLAQRLVEQDIPCNVDVLRRAVAQLKSHEDLRGYDREIFERATKLAIEYSRP